MSEDSIILKDISFSYKKDLVLKNINLHVGRNSIYGLIGPNGAGKTTTIRIILGLLKPIQGTISVNGNKDKKLKYANIGALIETPALYEKLNANDNLKIFTNYLRIKNSDRIIKETLEIVGLQNSSKKNVGSYSLGMKQRLGIAIALIGEKDLYILDEPTNGLDPSGIIEIKSLIKRLQEDYNKTILLCSHQLDQIEKICSHIGFIKNGEIIREDSKDNILIKHGLSKTMFYTGNISDKKDLLVKEGFQINTNNLLSKNYISEENNAQTARFLMNHDIDIYQMIIDKSTLENIYSTLYN